MNKDLINEIRKIIIKETKYLHHYDGIVIDVNDPAPTKKVE